MRFRATSISLKNCLQHKINIATWNHYHLLSFCPACVIVYTLAVQCFATSCVFLGKTYVEQRTSVHSFITGSGYSKLKVYQPNEVLI